jgi:hypothetical protein
VFLDKSSEILTQGWPSALRILITMFMGWDFWTFLFLRKSSVISHCRGETCRNRKWDWKGGHRSNNACRYKEENREGTWNDGDKRKDKNKRVGHAKKYDI